MFTAFIHNARRAGSVRTLATSSASSVSNTAGKSSATHTSSTLVKVATASAIIGAGISVLFSPERGDADFLDCQNHCNDGYCTASCTTDSEREGGSARV